MSRTREIFEKVDRKLKERADEYRDVGAVYKIVLGGADGGTWIIDFRQASIGVREEEGGVHDRDEGRALCEPLRRETLA